MTTSSGHLPIFLTTKQAYGLLLRHGRLHLKAIWTPVIFLVTAEFLYHKIVGNASGVTDRWNAVLSAPWYMTAGAAVAWLTGVKFLLSFSISWRRRLLLGESFDPFFFKQPFWRYLGFLIATYAWIGAVLAGSFLLARSLLPESTGLARWAVMMMPGVLFIVWGIVRQVPYFTCLTLDRPQPGWSECAALMRGNVLRYLTAWLLAMAPLAAANGLLDAAISLAGLDVRSTPVALSESAFRQAMTFLHFSLGASIGALTCTALGALLPFASAPPSLRHRI